MMDKYDIFGKYVAAQLRCLPSRSFFVLQEKIQSLITAEQLNCMAQQSLLASFTTEDGYNEPMESNSRREELYRISGVYEEPSNVYRKPIEPLNQYGGAVIEENSKQHVDVDYSLETKDKYYWDENNTEAGVDPCSSKESVEQELPRGHSVCFTTEGGVNSVDSNYRGAQSYMSIDHEASNNEHLKQRDPLEQQESVNKTRQNCFKQDVKCEDDPIDIKDQYDYPQSDKLDIVAVTEPITCSSNEGMQQEASVTHSVCFTTEGGVNSVDSNSRGAQSYMLSIDHEASNNEHLKQRDPLEHQESVNKTRQNCFEQDVKCEDDSIDIKDQYDYQQSDKLDIVAVTEPITCSSNEGMQQEASVTHSVCFPTKDGDKDLVESSSVEGKSCNRLFGKNGESSDDHLKSREIPDCHKDTNIEPNYSEQNLEEVSHSLKSKDKNDCAPNNTANDEAVVDPLPSSSKENVEKDLSDINTCWLPSSTIKSELEDVDMNAPESEGDENSEDEVGQEEKLEEGSDVEMDDDDTDEGAYHLAEVSYGEEDDEDSQKPGGTEPNAILGISHDFSDSNPIILNDEGISGDESDTMTDWNTKSLKRGKLLLYYCELCDYQVNRQDLFLAHLQGHTDTVKKTFNCPQCAYKTNILTRLKSHIRSHCTVYKKRSVKFNCVQCKYTTNRKDLLENHLHMHSPDFSYFCSICDFKTDTYTGLKTHMKVHLVNNMYTCNKCEYKTVKGSALREHYRIHMDDKPFTCNECLFSCASKNSLTKHMRIHTGEAPYSCKLCDKRFKQSGHLTEHMRRHTGEKPFVCPICDYRCAYRGLINKHMQSHSSEKPFACTVCSYRSKSRYGLNTHMRTHTGEKVHVCSLCNYSCNSSSQLKDHAYKHNGESPPFACNLCESKFPRARFLKKHLEAHKRVEPVACKVCGRTFISKVKLNEHTITHEEQQC